MKKEYIMEDSNGILYNAEFKPDFVKYGDRYHGYANNSQETLFYYFAVLGYDIQFDYNGVTYCFLSDEEYVAWCTPDFKTDLEIFSDAISMIRKFKIEGTPLLDLVDLLENADVH